MRTLGKDHSSSVVRIPTHTLVSYFPRVVSYGSQSHALLSKPLEVSVTRTQVPCLLSHTLLFQLSNSIKYFLTVKIENINHRDGFGPDVDVAPSEVAAIVRFKYLF